MVRHIQNPKVKMREAYWLAKIVISKEGSVKPTFTKSVHIRFLGLLGLINGQEGDLLSTQESFTVNGL